MLKTFLLSETGIGGAMSSFRIGAWLLTSFWLFSALCFGSIYILICQSQLLKRLNWWIQIRLTIWFSQSSTWPVSILRRSSFTLRCFKSSFSFWEIWISLCLMKIKDPSFGLSPFGCIFNHPRIKVEIMLKHMLFGPTLWSRIPYIGKLDCSYLCEILKLMFYLE